MLSDTKDYVASAWSSSSYTYKVEKPNAPSLSVNNVSANKTTFTWSANKSDTSTKWYYRSYYRTKCDDKPNDNSKGWGKWTVASSSSYTYTDNKTGKTRVFQIKSIGPAGYSAVKTAKHYLGTAFVAKWDSPQYSVTKYSSYYKMTYNVVISGATNRTENVVPQYFIGTPTSAIGCPADASWVDGTTYSYNSKKTKYQLPITTNTLVGYDECLWARIKTTHDGIDTFSEALRVRTGSLTAPSLTVSMGTPTTSGFTVTITVDDAGTDVPGTYMEVYLERASMPGEENYIRIGTIPNGTSSRAITSTENITGEVGYAIQVRNVSQDGSIMKSGYYTYSTSMPSAPTLNPPELTTTTGKVHLTWTNNWASSTGVIIAWTDDPDNWMSNEDPETYEIEDLVNEWFITGLETGKTWYFRVRNVNKTDDGETLTPWSAERTVELTSAPVAPVLELSDEVITEDGMVTAYWSFVSSDSSTQIAAEIVEATFTGGDWDDEEEEWTEATWTYGRVVGSTSTEQHIDIYAREQGWANGSTVYLALQTRSGSGSASVYSDPVPLVIAAKPTVTISATDFVSTETLTERFLADGTTDTFLCAYTMTGEPEVTVDGDEATVTSYTDGEVVLSAAPAEGSDVYITYSTTDNHIMTEVPFELTVLTTGSSALSVAIERAETYQMVRPNGVVTDGPAGETIYVYNDSADPDQTITINMNDLIGTLDDGAWYYLIAKASNDYGQNAQDVIPFKVHWAHQAWAPTATFITDTTNYIARITPVAGADYALGDTCDIYRIGIDNPELVVTGGTFGTEYVDPYPSFGPDSGYEIVTVTKYGDYITEDDTFASFDTTETDPPVYTQLDSNLMIIDFDGQRAELEYNITLDNSWTKDFKRTTYLGGHVAGDHNRAVTRDLSSSTVLVKGGDSDMQALMRALARYTGICHVRTPDGSSFAADVQVTEGMAFNSGVVDYNLKIQKVDTNGTDGMTYADWLSMQNED